ncbi:redoxin domain-containing protein [Daejeonella sp. JGW-45]|uniref:TlpA family protein disulfide reductase n=1 Tax=Daejeonella sp. JGW-45 TaxID=3034148 RepID=UPI0023EB9212|nr:redoxin domain-containing protein [Daejeonella sp. JGW-45]
MKKTIQLIAVATLCFFLSSVVYGQTAALKIGDKVPDLTINNILNYKTSSAKLSDFNGKLLILDFWATWCGACIQSFPKMESLQAEFKDKLQVLLVSSDGSEKNEAFFTKRKASTGKAFTLPRVDGDQSLKQLFPYKLLPHYVWIADGKVKAITSSYEVSKESIRAMLNSDVRLVTKTDINLEMPLYLSDKAPADRLEHYSIFLKGFTEGLGSSNRYRKENGSVYSWMSTNSTLLWFYNHIASKLFSEMGESFVSNRVIVETRDSARLYYTADRAKSPAWRNANLYSYELLVPLHDTARLYKYALEDLNRYTDFTMQIEKRRVKCLLLERSKNGLLTTTGQSPSVKKVDDTMVFSNTGLIDLIIRMNGELGMKVPVLDRTGYSGKMDMKIRPAWNNLPLLNAELARYGLVLRDSEEELLMMIIKEK